MLAQLLAIIVGIGSFVLFTDAFLFPEVHRKGDFTWSGVGFVYALVLWVCAGQFTGGILLGQVAGVAFLTWLEWQMISLRWQGIAPDYRARASSLGAILVKTAGQLQQIGRSVVDRTPSPKSTPLSEPVPGSTTVETAVTATRDEDSYGDVAAELDDFHRQDDRQPTVETPAVEMGFDDAIAPSTTGDVVEAESTSTDAHKLEPDVVTAETEVVTAESGTIATEVEVLEVPSDDYADDSELPEAETIPAAVEVPAASRESEATTATPMPAKPMGILAQLTNGWQQLLINLGLKKKSRPMIVLDRTPKTPPTPEIDSQADQPDEPDPSTDPVTEDLTDAVQSSSSETITSNVQEATDESVDSSISLDQVSELEPSETEPSHIGETISEMSEQTSEITDPNTSTDMEAADVPTLSSETESVGETPEIAMVDVTDIFPDEEETSSSDSAEPVAAHSDESSSPITTSEQASLDLSVNSHRVDNQPNEEPVQGPENTASSTS